jgi:hypothetical protein
MDLERHNSGMVKKSQPKPPNMPFEEVVDRLLKPAAPKPKQDKGSRGSLSETKGQKKVN